MIKLKRNTHEYNQTFDMTAEAKAHKFSDYALFLVTHGKQKHIMLQFFYRSLRFYEMEGRYLFG